MPAWQPAGSFVDGNSNALFLTSTALGYQMPVTPPPGCLFADNFDGTVIDIINRWVAPVLAGAGTMTQAGGNLVPTLGTTANNGAAIASIESFTPAIGALISGVLLTTEAVTGTNTNRCFGFYTRPGSFTAATPVQDGYVWELDITGAFGVSIYNAGTRIFRQTFTLISPVNVIAISYQALTASFYFNNLAVPVVSVPILGPNTITLPIGIHLINHTAGPALAPIWSVSATAVIDQTGSLDTQFNGQAISRTRAPGKFIPLNAVAINAETTIWTPASGRKFRLMGYQLTALGAAGNVVLKDNTAGASLPIVLPFGAIGANLSVAYPGMGNGILSAAANNVLTATGAASQTLSGYLLGTEE